MKGESVSRRKRRRGRREGWTEGSKEAEEGGYEVERTEAACGEESLMELSRPRVWRA